MTKRWRWVLRVSAVTLLLGGLALPSMHWRLFGWWRGEAFCDGRPTTYWSLAVRGGVVVVIKHDQPPQSDVLVSAPATGLQVFLRFVDRYTGLFPDSHGLLPVSLYKAGPPALPVFTALLGDSDPRVRGFAAAELRCMGRMALPAVPSLRGLAGETGTVVGGSTVRDFVAEALTEIITDDGDDQP